MGRVDPLEPPAGYEDLYCPHDVPLGEWCESCRPALSPGDEGQARDTRDTRDSDDDPTEAERRALADQYASTAQNAQNAHNHSSARSARSARWEPPVPLGAVGPLPPFPIDALPGPVRDHVVAVAEFTQTPVDLPACVALASLATAAGGRVVVEVRGPWREPTNLYVVVAMPPGSRKSAVFAELTRPLLDAEQSLIKSAAPSITEAEVLREIAGREAHEARAAAARADGDGREELRDEAVTKAELAEAITVPARPRLIADDITPEAAATLLAEQGGRLGVLSAEGGIFQIIGGRYSNGPSLEVFLKGHAGDLLRVDRKNRPPEHIPRPALTLGLTVQPDVLRTIADMPGFRGRGLLARILYSLPENTVGHRKVGAPPPDQAVADRYAAGLANLVVGLHEWTDPAVLTLTGEAARLILDAERALEPRLAPHAELGHIADWASKLIGATARVAGLLHLAGGGGVAQPIAGDTMAAAIAIGDYFTAHALAVFDAMGADPDLVDARAVIDWLDRTGKASFTRRDAYAQNRARFRKAADVDPVLELLVEHGYVRRRPAPERQGSGRPPSPTYDVHPDLTMSSR